MEGVKPLVPSPVLEHNVQRSLSLDRNGLNSNKGSSSCVHRPALPNGVSELVTTSSVISQPCTVTKNGSNAVTSNSATVTKAAPNSLITPPEVGGGTKPSAKRAMDFDGENFPSPAGEIDKFHLCILYKVSNYQCSY